MISNRKGFFKISKRLYDSDNIDNALFGLRIKVYEVQYRHFDDIYDIYFTSPFIDEVKEGCEINEYNLNVSQYGFWLNVMEQE